MSRKTKQIIFQVVLFVITFITTTLAGSEFASGLPLSFNPNYSWNTFLSGLQFSVPLLLILTVHEFGHYFTAMYHKVRTSLPYYIPIPPIPVFLLNFGTMGALIRLRSRPKSNLQNFDIGLAGPLAGFVVALLALFYAYRTLPPAEYIFQFHPEYKQYGLDYASHAYDPQIMKEQKAIDVQIGSSLITWLFQQVATDPARIPNPHEIMHYPVLMACYFALFVTCLNLLPIGQLDGGHVVYGLFGFKKHKVIATVFFIALIFYSGLGWPYIKPDLPKDELLLGIVFYVFLLFQALKGLRLPTKDTAMYTALIFAVQFLLLQYVPGVEGYGGWLIFGVIIGRFIGIEHPPSEIEQPLDSKRILLGWITLLIFILCFSPAPIMVNVPR
ncbi:site-2 protease family protein [Fulvivirgaceae bacterium PWU4]|uniref:Site-2 protease family protein n=1 Tax=Chryseosolibacter histidini TaxID=2782349 RepID=A0AAP2DLB7_9BACT|nr:site-2 protease family protein [Chryseosolibacter histidini]MBT1698351.1 site-2 protease family protein [Chryseosolibacter histidini]